jgi:hypothetical protein
MIIKSKEGGDRSSSSLKTEIRDRTRISFLFREGLDKNDRSEDCSLPSPAMKTDLLHTFMYKIKFLAIQEDFL